MPSDIELRLRAAYEASASLIGDSPLDKDQAALAPDVSGLTDSPKRPRWLTPFLAAATVLIVAAGTLLTLDHARSNRVAGPPVLGRVSSGESPPPSLVQSETHYVLTYNTVQRLDQPVEWVKTTTHKWAALQSGSTTSLPADVDIYVVQIRGAFICLTCKTPRPVTGSVMILELPLKPNQQIGDGFIMGNISYDLSRIGTVHVFHGS